jgi:pimeloyl-ACP methyl ester carboxylesterase
MFANAAQWEPQLEARSDEYTPIASDVRGHGRTGGSDLETDDFDRSAAGPDALLLELEVDDPVRCGLSGVGCIAQVFAANHVEDLAALVPADTFAASPEPLAGRLIFAKLRCFGLLGREIRYPTVNRLQRRRGGRPHDHHPHATD